jgi:hypothetical protein
MKLQYVRMLASVAVFTMATTASLQANAAPSGIDNEFHKIEIVNPNDYPRMTDKEIGHVRHIARISRNPSGDWSGFDSIYMPLQGEKMFVISFMAYTLELAQHELTPAYHEIYKTSIENLLKKMQHPDPQGQHPVQGIPSADRGRLSDALQRQAIRTAGSVYLQVDRRDE